MSTCQFCGADRDVVAASLLDPPGSDNFILACRMVDNCFYCRAYLGLKKAEREAEALGNTVITLKGVAP